MEHICGYFDLSFAHIIEMMSSIARCFDEHKLISYQSYEKSLMSFPNVDEMNISVDITPLNFNDVKNLYFERRMFQGLVKYFSVSLLILLKLQNYY